jgi:SAM-dependent methyltransferase
MPESTCPLCLQPIDRSAPLVGADGRRFQHCQHCRLITAVNGCELSLEQCRDHYQTHQNGPEHPGYVQFLQRLAIPLRNYLQPHQRGLDFGCGPGPTLSGLLGGDGRCCHNYDPLFFPNLPAGPFDFITVTECCEHFEKPRSEFAKFANLLRPGGHLGIMTELCVPLDQFARWYYTRDPTHITFYHPDSFSFICKEFGLEHLWSDRQRVTILRKRSAYGATHAQTA